MGYKNLNFLFMRTVIYLLIAILNRVYFETDAIQATIATENSTDFIDVLNGVEKSEEDSIRSGYLDV